MSSYHPNSISYYYETGQEAKLREQLLNLKSSITNMHVNSLIYKSLDAIHAKQNLLLKIFKSPFDYQDNEYIKKLLIYTAVRSANIESIELLYKNGVIEKSKKIENLIQDLDSHIIYPSPQDNNFDITNTNILKLQEYYKFDLFAVKNIIVENALSQHDFLALDKLLAKASGEQILQLKTTLRTVRSLGFSMTFGSSYYIAGIPDPTGLCQNVKLFNPFKSPNKKRLENEVILNYIDAKLEKIEIEKNYPPIDSNENKMKVSKL